MISFKSLKIALALLWDKISGPFKPLTVLPPSQLPEVVEEPKVQAPVAVQEKPKAKKKKTAVKKKSKG